MLLGQAHHLLQGRHALLGGEAGIHVIVEIDAPFGEEARCPGAVGEVALRKEVGASHPLVGAIPELYPLVEFLPGLGFFQLATIFVFEGLLLVGVLHQILAVEDGVGIVVGANGVAPALVQGGEFVQRRNVGVRAVIYLRIVLLVPLCEVQNEAGLGHITDPVAEGEKDVIVACPDHGLVHGLDVDI